MKNDTPESREVGRNLRHRPRHNLRPSEAAEARYPLEDYPCSRCADPNEGPPHLVDNGSEFCWEHQHPQPPGSSHRSGCSRFGTGGDLCGSRPRPGTATSLFERHISSKRWLIRDEETYLKAKQRVEEGGEDDYRNRLIGL